MAVPSRHSTSADPILALLPSETEIGRYKTLLDTLSAWTPLFAGCRALDFGASWGTSMVALIRRGASQVVRVEPNTLRAKKEGQSLMAKVAPDAKAFLIRTPNTALLPFVDGKFKFILSNSVLEHILQPWVGRYPRWKLQKMGSAWGTKAGQERP